MLGARPFALAEDPLLRSTTDRIAAQLAILPPKLQLLDDGFPRAFVVGRGPRSSTLVVSSGLLTALTPNELGAVLAHELSHVRSRDVLTQTYAVLLSTTLLELTRVGGFLSRFLLAVLAPVASAFTHLMLSSKREFAADRTGAALGDPNDLADALHPPRSRRGARRVHRVARDRAALHREPVRPRGARRADVRDAPAARRPGRAAATGARVASRRCAGAGS